MSEENKSNQKPGNNKPILPGSGKPKFSIWWIIIPLLLIFIAFSFINDAVNSPKETNKTEFFSYLMNGDVKEVTVWNGRFAEVFLTTDALKSSTHKDALKPNALSQDKVAQYRFEFGDLELFQPELESAIKNNNLKTEYDYKTQDNTLTNFLGSLIPIILLIGVFIFVMRRMSGGAGGGAGGQIFNIGKSKAKLFDQKTDIKTTFKDVAGLEGAKEEIQEIVDFLKNPEKYTSLGGKIPKGALLIGSPGTGKTLLAKAVAGEAKVPFFSLSGSDFVEMFVGVGASRVRDLFKQAKEKSPSIIFIDEIDAIGRFWNKYKRNCSCCH